VRGWNVVAQEYVVSYNNIKSGNDKINMTRLLYFLSVEKIVMLLLLTYPTLMLTVKGGMNAVFLLALLLALMVWLV